MPGTLTLGQARDQLRQRTDNVGNNFFGDTELNGYLSGSYKELYDMLVQKFGDDYFFTTANYTMDGLTDLWALPPDFYKLLGVDLSLTGGNPEGWVTLKQFMINDRNRYAVPNFQSFYGITNLRYRLRGSTIWFTPLPSAGQKIRILYAPRPSELVNDSDTIDGVSGWEEYLIVDSAIKMAAKEESDPMVFGGQKQAMLARIEAAAENRNAGQSQTVQDTQGNWGPFGSYTNGEGGYGY